MQADDELPPHHVLSIKRLAMLTSGGASVQRIENQVTGMLVAWTTELGEDRSAFRDRLNELEEDLRRGLEDTEQAAEGSETKSTSQIVALRTALSVIRAAQERLGL